MAAIVDERTLPLGERLAALASPRQPQAQPQQPPAPSITAKSTKADAVAAALAALDAVPMPPLPAAPTTVEFEQKRPQWTAPPPLAPTVEPPSPRSATARAIATVQRLDRLDAELDAISGLPHRAERRAGITRLEAPAPLPGPVLEPRLHEMAEIEAEVEIVTTAGNPLAAATTGVDGAIVDLALPVDDDTDHLDAWSYAAYRSEVEEASVVIVRREAPDRLLPATARVGGAEPSSLRRRLKAFGGEPERGR